VEEHPHVTNLTNYQEQRLSGRYPNLSTLIAPNLISLEPDQVPKLDSLNAPNVDIKLADFPFLRGVYLPIKGWKRIRQEMRVKGWRYQRGSLIQPLAEKLAYRIAMRDKKNRGNVENALVEVYGEVVRDIIRDLEVHRPGITQEELVAIIESEATCENSSFFREPNIHAIADFINKDRDKHWEVLSAGCGHGPEAHQLGTHLMEMGIDFHIDGVDINPASVAQAQSGRGRVDDFYRNFFHEMADKGILRLDQGGYELNDDLKKRMDFKRHDLINSRASEKTYDVVICNNVLQHFPRHTRELILIHILENLKDGVVLTFERNLFSFQSDTEQEWLDPYYKWKKNLSRFGLMVDRIENKHSLLKMPVVVYRYHDGKNKFKNGEYAIRDGKLVKK
jgi:chemotaxis methyl-accepting protein methylase